MTKELPSNTSSSWPPIKINEQQRNARLRYPSSHHVALALALLVDFVGRGIDDQQYFGPGPPRLGGRPRFPHVLAHQNTGADAVEVEHSGERPGGEVALLVENAVVGQASLAVVRENLPVADHDGRVENHVVDVLRIARHQA